MNLNKVKTLVLIEILLKMIIKQKYNKLNMTVRLVLISKIKECLWIKNSNNNIRINNNMWCINRCNSNHNNNFGNSNFISNKWCKIINT